MRTGYLTILFCISMMNYHTLVAQGVTIGSGNAPHNSAVLDLQSVNKGFLPPRLTTAQRKAIPSPAAGLVVFDTDFGQLFLYNGSQWLPLSTNGDSRTQIPAQQTLQPKEQQEGSGLGTDVALGDIYAVVGAPSTDSGSKIRAGAVHIYKKSSGAWVKIASKFAKDATDEAYFGGSVAIAGNYIVVGAPGFKVNNYQNAGKVYVFVKGAGDSWTEQAGITRPNAKVAEYFGYDVGISASVSATPVIAVGVPYHNYPNSTGAVEIITLVSKVWTITQTLLPSNLSKDDGFGYSVNLRNDYIAIGAPFKNNTTYNYTGAGAVYIYVYGGGTWSLQKQLSGTTKDAQFGSAIALGTDLIAISAPRAKAYTNTTPLVHIYQRQASDWIYYQQLYIYNTAGYDISNFFGGSLEMENNYLLVGLPAGKRFPYPSTFSYFNQKTAVFVYKKSQGSFNGFLLHRVLEDNESAVFATNSLFGNSLSIKNNQYLIGIPGKMIDGVSAGAIAFGVIE